MAMISTSGTSLAAFKDGWGNGGQPAGSGVPFLAPYAVLLLFYERD